MKFYNILKFIILMLITSILNAQDFYSYKLFDNKFQVVFPGDPSRVQIPKELLDPKEIEKSIPYKYKKGLSKQQIKKVVSDIINRNSIQAFQYADRINKIAYTSQFKPSGFKYDIGEYKQSTKKMLDETHIEPLKASGHTIINFTSTFNRKKNSYIAISTSSYYLEGQKRFKSMKYIIYKKKSYTWSVMYSNISDKSIFDSYRQSCKVIK